MYQIFTIFVILVGTNAKPQQFEDTKRIYPNMEITDYIDCISRTGVEMKDFHADPPDPKVLCFYKCAAETVGVINDDGTLNMDQIKSMPVPQNIDQDQYNESMDCIGKIEKLENCEDMKLFGECVKKNS